MYRCRMTKADLHRLVDRLSDEAVDSVARLLELAAEDPAEFMHHNAAWDDERVTAEEEGEVAAARKQPSIPLDQLLREVES